MKAENRLFDRIYRLDEATNCYMIEIALDQYADIFNEWDPAPFKRREIDPDLELYLEGSSEEILPRYSIELCFTLPKGMRNERIEQESREGIKNSFSFKMYLLRKKLKRTNTKMVRLALLGLGFLWIGTFFTSRFGETALISILSESIFIGGWVLIWEAVSLFFFTNLELYDRYRMYKRLLDAPLLFREVEDL